MEQSILGTLPPELRECIYQEVLRHDTTTDQITPPALLRTCRNIYREALPVFHAESTFYIDVQFHDPPIPRGQHSSDRRLYLNGSMKSSIPWKQTVSSLDVRSELPLVLRKCGSVAMRITVLSLDDYIDASTPLSYFLYAFCDFMAEGPAKCKELRIDFTGMRWGSTRFAEEYYTHGLYPLAKLPTTVAICLTGLPQALQDRQMLFMDGRYVKRNLPELTSSAVFRGLEELLSKLRALLQPSKNIRDRNRDRFSTCVKMLKCVTDVIRKGLTVGLSHGPITIFWEYELACRIEYGKELVRYIEDNVIASGPPPTTSGAKRACWPANPFSRRTAAHCSPKETSTPVAS